MSFAKELKENLAELSNEIKKLQKVGEVLAESEFNEKTIIWLISRASGLPQKDCEAVITSLQDLEAIFLKHKENK